MSSIYQKEQTLPAEVHETFDLIADDIEQRNLYAAALRGAGWTLSSIAEAAGISRERVRQVAADVGLPKTLVVPGPLPSPPLKPASAAPKEYAKPDPAKLARMLELQPAARKVTGNSQNNRDEAEEYTRIIADVHLNDGVPLYRLAIYLGVTAGALRSRLGRYEYLMPKTGKSKSYNRINPANRNASV